MSQTGWPISRGKSIEDYQREVACPLSANAFEESLREYLGAQLGPSLEPVVIKNLFQIICGFIIERKVVSMMLTARVQEDWRMRWRLLKFVESDLKVIHNRAKRALGKTDKPSSCLLAKSVVKRVNFWLRELEQVAVFQRAQESMFRILRESTKNQTSCVWMLHRYLATALPQLQQQHEDLIIAGAMISGGVKKSGRNRDHVANIPMARSRARRDMAAEDGVVVPWRIEVQS